MNPFLEPNGSAARAREAARRLSFSNADAKNEAIRRMARALSDAESDIFRANREDMELAQANGLSQTLCRRLLFDEAKLQGRIRSLEKIACLPDPIGQLEEPDLRPNGLSVCKMRVPLGVLLMIYEARPHVTVNGGALAIKSGNAILLRGGSEARGSNEAIGRLWRTSLSDAGLPEDAVQVISCSHEALHEILQRSDLIDLVIPRGGPSLIRAIAERSRIPTIKHAQGICHVYVGEGAKADKAVPIVLDSKTLMPEVCNAAETVLVDSSRLDLVQDLVAGLTGHGVEVRGCPQVRERVPSVIPATDEDWDTEHLDLVVSMKVVRDIDEAIHHIDRHGSGHTDAIVTENHAHARRFAREVDSAVVLINASTMFCDGESLGMGAEIGISTDKFHARGPLGLKALTSTKFIIEGTGHIMGGV